MEDRKVDMDLIKQVQQIEGSVGRLTEVVRQLEMKDVSVEKDISSLKGDMMDLKASVIQMVSEQNERTWDLINKGIKIICVLVFVIALLSGIKIIPELIKMI